MAPREEVIHNELCPTHVGIFEQGFVSNGPVYKSTEARPRPIPRVPFTREFNLLNVLRFFEVRKLAGPSTRFLH